MKIDANARRGLVAAALAPAILGIYPTLLGRTYFWGDLTYINHPWRLLPSQQVQVGLAPLWNPYAYLGMPMAAQMQNGVFYPGSVFFQLFSFETATALFLTLHFALPAFFGFLWLRREGFSPSACWAGASILAMSGIALSHLPFLNQFSSLAYLPAVLLFRDRAALLGLSLALCFLSGYPTFVAGAAGLLLVWALVRGRRPELSCWLAAASLSAASAALLLLPALQLAASTQRTAGLAPDEVFAFQYAPRDLLQWIGRLALSSREYQPALYWWKTSYLGVFGFALALAGVARLKRRVALAWLAAVAAIFFCTLGGSTAWSARLWLGFAPLRLLRYPGNIAFMAVPLFAAAAAAGLHRRKGALGTAGALLVAADLLAYGLSAQPILPRGYFGDKGPLAPQLQKTLGAERYLLSARALQWHRGGGANVETAALDLKHRLYGVTNMPYRLRSVANFGEPLVPWSSYRYMDFLYTLSGARQAAEQLPWAGARVLMTREPQEIGPSVVSRGLDLWQIYEARARVSRAYRVSEQDGGRVPQEAQAEPPKIERTPLDVRDPRPDRVEIDGEGAGWVYVAEPKTTGWRASLNGRPVETERAMTAFQKLRVPAGKWRLVLRYFPATWAAGVALSVLTLLALGAYWYNRASRFSRRHAG